MVLTLRRALALVGLALVGCGTSAPAGGDRPVVVATTGFLADIAHEVAGPEAQVVQLVPDSASPHNYGASAKDRQRLADADLVFAVGAGYEEALPLEEAGTPVLALADHAGTPRGRGDPHVWMDPTRVAAALPALAAALGRVDGKGTAGYERRARAHAAELRALDAELRRILAAVPRKHRKLVTSHDSLGYFADRYRFTLVGAPFGLQPEAEASAERVAEVIAAVRREEVPAVFAEQGDDPQVMRQIAREAGVRVVDDLLIENPGPGGETYVEALRLDARRIAAALGG